MTLDDYDQFCEVVMGFAELKGKQLSPPAIELYFRALQHWSLDGFRAAGAQLLSSCQFMPTPYDFEQLRKAGQPTPGEAWAEVLEHVRFGRYRTQPLPGNELANRVVAMLGGWHVIAMHGEETIHFLERRFAENYETLQDRVDKREALPQLTHHALRRLT